MSLLTAPMLAVKKHQRLDVLSSLGLLIDVSSDGKTFLIAQPTAEKPQAIVALNWAASVRAPLR